MNEQVIIWEAPELKAPEFRLYYDESGKVLFYSGEQHEGNYIVIDALTFAEARPDIRVVDGKIVRPIAHTVVSKLQPSDDGVCCHHEDVNVITEVGKYWKLKINEL